MNAEDYLAKVMDGELFDFWLKGMEDKGWLLVIKDSVPYHKGVTITRREQLEEDGWISWGPGTWPANSLDLNPIENIWHVMKSNIRKRRPRVLTQEMLR